MSDSKDESQDSRRLRQEQDNYRNNYGNTSGMMIHNQDMLASKRTHFEGVTVQNGDNDNVEERRISTRPDSAEGEAPIYQLHPESDEQTPESDPSGESLTVVSGWDHWKNITLYMIAGYVLSILLVLIWYYRHPRRASQDLSQKWLLIVLFFLLLMILGYSRATRCVVALIFPTLGSHRGRALLMTLAFFVAGTGPVMNIIRNIDSMGHSLACGQSSLRQALTPMQDIMGQPINVVERSVEGTIMQVRKIMESLDKVLQHLEEPLVAIHDNCKSCAEWLRQQQRSFELQMGKPYERCLGAGAVSLHECQAKFGTQQECSLKDRFVWFCENLKDMSSFFERSGKLQQETFEEIFQRLKDNFTKIRAIFVVSIGFVSKQGINATNDSSGRDSDVILEHEINRHLEAERRTFILFFVCLDLAVFILVFAVILRSIYFRLLYLGSNDFNNVYLTHSFDSYDRERQPLVGIRVVPLRVSEMNKFVKITSIRLLPEEYQIMAGSILFLVITAVQLFCICFVDYSLYIMLSIMSYHAHKTEGLKPPAYTRIVITKGGMIGDILRSLVQAFEPLSENLGLGTEKCLPVPGEPNVLRYYEILSLCVLAWLLVFWEPYSLRVRHWVMACFYPEHAQRRVQYLHERILRERTTFIKTSRRRARSVHIYSDSRQFTCISWCSALKIWCLNGFPSAFMCKTCIICRKPLTASDIVHCDTENCRGIYCQYCFIESNNYCILCTEPRKYWDDSDLSEVEDSTEDSVGGSSTPDDDDVDVDVEADEEEFNKKRSGYL